MKESYFTKEELNFIKLSEDGMESIRGGSDSKRRANPPTGRAKKKATKKRANAANVIPTTPANPAPFPPDR